VIFLTGILIIRILYYFFLDEKVIKKSSLHIKTSKTTSKLHSAPQAVRLWLNSWSAAIYFFIVLLRFLYEDGQIPLLRHKTVAGGHLHFEDSAKSKAV
jgi:hypothetical protein